MLVVEGLTCRFGTKAAVDNASFSIAARQLRRRDRPLRRRQVDAAADDQPPRRTLRRPHPVRRRRRDGAARQGFAAMARALGDDLSAIQSGRPARRADQRADGAARRYPVLALADAALARRGQGAGDVGAGAVRHGCASPRSAPTSFPAASSSASRSRARWCRSRISFSPTSRSPRSIRATPGS